MSIQVLEYIPKVTTSSMGFINVRYHDVIFNCEIRVHKSRAFIWVKMPQKAENPQQPTQRFNVIHWPSKEVSDVFQETVKAELSLKFPEAVAIPPFKDAKKIMKSRVNPGRKPSTSDKPLQKKSVDPSAFVTPPPLKARNKSKFTGKY